MDKYNVLITTPHPLCSDVLSEEAEARLRRFANVTTNKDGRNWTSAEVAERLPGVDALLASWGQVKLTEQVLAKADRLRMIGYAAGSVKGWITDAVFERGIVVSHAAARIADSVAEYALTMALMGLRRPLDIGRKTRSGIALKNHDVPTYDIAGKKVPYWLNEGLAELAEAEFGPPDMHLYRQARAQQQLFTLARLEGPFQQLSGMQVFLAYQQSYAVVRFLLDNYGWQPLRDLLFALGKGDTISQAFDAALGIYGLSYSSFEQHWRESG